jgi:hypothetical protein
MQVMETIKLEFSLVNGTLVPRSQIDIVAENSDQEGPTRTPTITTVVPTSSSVLAIGYRVALAV